MRFFLSLLLIPLARCPRCSFIYRFSFSQMSTFRTQNGGARRWIWHIAFFSLRPFVHSPHYSAKSIVQKWTTRESLKVFFFARFAHLSFCWSFQCMFFFVVVLGVRVSVPCAQKEKLLFSIRFAIAFCTFHTPRAGDQEQQRTYSEIFARVNV